MNEPSATENRTEQGLLAQLGRLQLERETHIARLRVTEQQMQQVRVQLMDSKGKNG